MKLIHIKQTYKNAFNDNSANDAIFISNKRSK